MLPLTSGLPNRFFIKLSIVLRRLGYTPTDGAFGVRDIANTAGQGSEDRTTAASWLYLRPVPK